MEVRSTPTVTGVWILDEETDHALEKLTQVDGMRIPTRIEITWHPASGDFNWFRCKVTEIEYNQSGSVTRF